MQLILVLHNIRSIYNVGAILRTAEGLGVTEVAYSGYTPKYDDAGALPHLREKLNRQIEKAALGAEKIVKQEAISNLEGWLKEKRVKGWTIIGLENNLTNAEAERKIWLNEVRKRDFQKVVLILGEEVSGIAPEIRAECDWFLEIPMKGQKESFNVSVATGIAAWEILKAN